MFDWEEYNHAGRQKLLTVYPRIVSAEKNLKCLICGNYLNLLLFTNSNNYSRKYRKYKYWTLGNMHWQWSNPNHSPLEGAHNLSPPHIISTNLSLIAWWLSRHLDMKQVVATLLSYCFSLIKPQITFNASLDNLPFASLMTNYSSTIGPGTVYILGQ